MENPKEEIRVVANRMKAKVPIGPLGFQARKLIELLDERRRSPSFNDERIPHWQKNRERLSAVLQQLSNGE